MMNNSYGNSCLKAHPLVGLREAQEVSMSAAPFNSIYVVIIPAIITGAFGIIDKLIDYWLKNRPTSTNTPGVRERVRTFESRDSFSMKRVFIHIFIVQFIATLLVPVIAFTLGRGGVLG